MADDEGDTPYVRATFDGADIAVQGGEDDTLDDALEAFDHVLERTTSASDQFDGDDGRGWS